MLVLVIVSSLLVCWGAQGAALGGETLPDSAVFSVDPPWLAVFRCFNSASPSTCLQKRAVRAIQDLLPDDDEDSEDDLPKGVSPAIARIIDRVGDFIASGISQWYPSSEADDVDAAKSSNDLEEGARGHKKKVKKAVIKAILKLLIVALVIKHKIKMLLMAAQTFLQFKFLLVAIVYVVSNIVKIWLDIKAKHHPQKVIYYENAHHQHHYEPDHHDFDDHEHGGGGWGLWGRSIAAPETTPPSNSGASGHHYDNYPRSLSAQDIVYAAHKPHQPLLTNH